MMVFFALLLGVVDFGQLIFSHQSLVERVRSAVRWGSLHPDSGVEPVCNMVLYNRSTAPEDTSATYLKMKPENVVVEYRGDPAVDVATLHIEIVNFEAPLFAPWWSGTSANKLISKRPVSASAPLQASPVTP